MSRTLEVQFVFVTVLQSHRVLFFLKTMLSFPLIILQQRVTEDPYTVFRAAPNPSLYKQQLEFPFSGRGPGNNQLWLRSFTLLVGEEEEEERSRSGFCVESFFCTFSGKFSENSAGNWAVKFIEDFVTVKSERSVVP